MSPDRTTDTGKSKGKGKGRDKGKGKDPTKAQLLKEHESLLEENECYRARVEALEASQAATSDAEAARAELITERDEAAAKVLEVESSVVALRAENAALQLQLQAQPAQPASDSGPPSLDSEKGVVLGWPEDAQYKPDHSVARPKDTSGLMTLVGLGETEAHNLYWNELLRLIRNLVNGVGLDPHILWKQQDGDKVTRLLLLARKQLPFVRRFHGDWLTRLIAVNYLEGLRKQANQKKKAAENAKRRRLVTS